MARRLIVDVAVGRDWYGPSYGQPPADVAALIMNPAVWEGSDDPTPEPASQAAEGEPTDDALDPEPSPAATAGGEDNSTPPADIEPPNFDDVTKADLLDMATARGINIPSRATKDDIIAALTDGA